MTSIFTWRDGKTHAPCVVLENVLHKEGRENVIKTLKDKTQTGTHVQDDGTICETTSEQRDSDVSFFNDVELRRTLRECVDVVNYETGWKYDIIDCEDLQFTVYDGAKKQHYDWHTDGQGCHNNIRKSVQFHQPKDHNLLYTPQINLLGTVRKISVSALLNEGYEGGELMFRWLDEDSNLKEVSIKCGAGDLVIFPSFIDHKVAPVTKGIRYSVVAWFGGPPFK
tara:strand:+ start:150 stop:821 length:672 start_codon:yes stop_codon:yes gene_type:complete